MMFKKCRALNLFILCSLVLAFAGCTQVSRGLGSITANKYAKPRSGSVWGVAPPMLEPAAFDNRTVYISARNISDADVDLTETLFAGARACGYQVVNDPTEANYRLRASVRFFGEVDPASGGTKILGQMGGIAGAATAAAGGAAIGYGVSELTDSRAWGTGVGVGAGALFAQGLGNASRPREYALIVDMVLEEYSEEKITFELAQDNRTDATDRAGTGNSRMNSGGRSRTGDTNQGSMKQTSNYFPHGLRLSAWANQMNMSEEEAMPLITARVKKVMKQILP